MSFLQEYLEDHYCKNHQIHFMKPTFHLIFDILIFVIVKVKESDKKTVLYETNVQAVSTQQQTSGGAAPTTRSTRTTRLQSKRLSNQQQQQQQVLSSPEKSQPLLTSIITTATSTTAVITNITTTTATSVSKENEGEQQMCTEQLAARSAQLTLTSPTVSTSSVSCKGDEGTAVRRLQMLNSQEKLIINQTTESPRSPVKVNTFFRQYIKDLIVFIKES